MPIVRVAEGVHDDNAVVEMAEGGREYAGDCFQRTLPQIETATAPELGA